MNILFITKDDPFKFGGGSFATRAYLKAFSDLCDGNITVVLPSECKIDSAIRVKQYIRVRPRSFLNRIAFVFTGHLHRNIKTVKNLLKKSYSEYDLCVFNNCKVSTGLIDVVRHYNIRTTTIHHNVEPEYVRDNTRNFIIRSILLYHVRRAEKKSYALSDYNLFLTNQDKDFFHDHYPKNNSINEVLGVFEFNSLPVVKPKIVNQRHIVFAITGSLCTIQGVDGVKYFFKNLYQYLPENCEVVISGRTPTKEIMDICDCYPNVKLIPNPYDMSSIIEKADIYICPTRLGGGLKLRVMDGLRLGIPVITHSCSARGYDNFYDSPFFKTFETKNEFKIGIEQLICYIESQCFSRINVRELYAQLFSYDAGLNRLEAIYGS